MLSTQKNEIKYYLPTPEDGFSLNQLVENSPPLDPNSVYCNLLQCAHFSDTSIAAKQNDELVGFISGYQLPDTPSTLFIWQIVVSKKLRGQGVGFQMLESLLKRPKLKEEVSHLATTITDDNQASWGLFQKLAKRQDKIVEIKPYFESAKHFQNQHATETLIKISLK